MEPHEDLIRFTKQYRGRPLAYRRKPKGPYLPALRYEVYGERTYQGMLQILTFFLDYVVWINICPMRNPRIST